ncbi:MAG: N-acetylmuramoyl-L-alanine amidase, partial [Kutzneria sp.]|nr:N-acetylmuramoyl-L-alanine amidase [Kutzneria sp.]
MRGHCAVVAGTASLVLALSVTTPATATASVLAPGVGQSRQQVFAAAAAEFGVPEEVLLGVSYLESRWDANAGAPSVAAGYGPMHLTDFAAASAGTEFDRDGGDPRGDGGRPVRVPARRPADVPTAESQTLTAAAALLGVAPARLRSDPAQNIRGGAALLADYQRRLGLGRSARGADWYGAVAGYGGATDTGAAGDFANEVFSTIRQGTSRTTDDGQQVRLTADPAISPDTSQLDRLGLRRP